MVFGYSLRRFNSSYSSDDGSAVFNCSIIGPSRNATGSFEFDRGWEGIPANFIINSFLFIITIIIFALLRRKAWDRKSKQLTRTHKGWLQFIYGDRETLSRHQATEHRNEHHNHDYKQSNLLVPPSMGRSIELQGDDVVSVEDINSVPESRRNGAAEARERTEGVRVTGNRKYEQLSNDIESQEMARDEQDDNGKTSRTGRTRLDRANSIESVSHFGYWLLDVLLIKDQEILFHKGPDAVQYLIFQRYIIYFLFLLTAICLTIILPINLQGNLEAPTKPFGRTTVSNLEASSSLLWVHAIFSIALVPVGIVMMCHFSKKIKSSDEQFAKRTLFIRRIPKSKRVKEVLVNFIMHRFPELVIEGVQFVYDSQSIKTLQREYNNVVNAKLYCDDYFTEYRERMEIRPYFLGHFGGFFCCCDCCPKTDGLQYYTSKEHELERQIEKEFRSTITSPRGSVFITFKTEKMAQSVYKYLRENQEKSCSYCPCFSFCLRFGAWLKRLFLRKQDDLKSQRWLVTYAPSPEDINWDDISVDFKMIWLRRILVHLLLFVLFFFLTTPPILINTLNYLKLTDTLNSGLKSVSPLLTEYLSPLLLVIASVILPAFVILASQYLPYKTISEQNHSIMWKVYVFLVMMVLILPSLGLTSAKALVEVLATNNKTFRWQCLFPVDNGAFFVNYVLQSALLGNAMELLRFPELFLYFFFTIFSSRTPAEYENARQQILFDFSFGVRYPRFLLIFCMVVTYSLSCPLIAPCGLLYMGLKHLVDRYNIFYVYTPSKINDRIHSTAIMFFHIAILMMQFQVFTFSFLRTGYSDVTGLSMISVIVTLIIFSVLYELNTFGIAVVPQEGGGSPQNSGQTPNQAVTQNHNTNYGSIRPQSPSSPMSPMKGSASRQRLEEPEDVTNA